MPASKLRTKHTTTRSTRVPLLSTLPPSNLQGATGGSKQRRPAQAIPRPRSRVPASSVTQAVMGSQGTLLDLVDNLLNRGVLVTGEAVLGVANVDLVYLRLTALLAAADRVFPHGRARGGAG
ncbi:MAG TPA: gas vesicle protein GvpJ [Myxococcaceae bacterium]|jgi:hypothetical protein